MKTLKNITIVLALALAIPVFADDQPAAQPAASAMAVHEPDLDATPAEVVDAAKETIETATTYFTGTKEGDKAAKTTALFLLISAVLKLLLSLLKVTSSWWRQTKAKPWLKVVTVALGVPIFFLTTMVAGEPWWVALQLAMAGPFAMVWHEVSKLIPAIKAKKEEG